MKCDTHNRVYVPAGSWLKLRVSVDSDRTDDKVSTQIFSWKVASIVI